jgi:hypothetical protein
MTAISAVAISKVLPAMRAVGYNLRLVLSWLRILLRLVRFAIWRAFAIPSALSSAC